MTQYKHITMRMCNPLSDYTNNRLNKFVESVPLFINKNRIILSILTKVFPNINIFYSLSKVNPKLLSLKNGYLKDYFQNYFEYISKESNLDLRNTKYMMSLNTFYSYSTGTINLTLPTPDLTSFLNINKITNYRYMTIDEMCDKFKIRIGHKQLIGVSLDDKIYIIDYLSQEGYEMKIFSKKHNMYTYTLISPYDHYTRTSHVCTVDINNSNKVYTDNYKSMRGNPYNMKRVFYINPDVLDSSMDAKLFMKKGYISD